MGVFIMTSSKIGPFCDDVIKKKKEKKHFLCVFLLMTSSQYIYMDYVRIAPLYWKNFWA